MLRNLDIHLPYDAVGECASLYAEDTPIVFTPLDFDSGPPPPRSSPPRFGTNNSARSPVHSSPSSHRSAGSSNEDPQPTTPPLEPIHYPIPVAQGWPVQPLSPLVASDTPPRAKAPAHIVTPTSTSAKLVIDMDARTPLASTALWDRYAVRGAITTDRHEQPVQLELKLCSPDKLEYYTPGRVEERVRHEARVYNHLRSHQGSFVPRCYGLWRTTTSTSLGSRVHYALVLEYTGLILAQLPGCSTAWDSLERYYDALVALHEAGVVHGAVDAMSLATRVAPPDDYDDDDEYCDEEEDEDEVDEDAANATFNDRVLANWDRRITLVNLDDAVMRGEPHFERKLRSENLFLDRCMPQLWAQRGGMAVTQGE